MNSRIKMIELSKQLNENFCEFLKYAIEKEPKVDKQAVKHKYESWLVSGWCTNVKGKEHKIKNWKSTLLNTLSYLPKEQTQQPRIVID